MTTLRLGRYRRPFDAKREADWIAAAVDLSKVNVLVSGAKGWSELDADYEAVVEELSRRTGRTPTHQTYKQDCGEFYSASAVGFSVAVEIARQKQCAVLLYTLSIRGGKALCCVEP